MKEIYILKDVKLLGISNSLEIQWSKHVLEDNDKLFEKVNVRGTICLDLPDNSEEENKLIEDLKKENLEPEAYLIAENKIKEKMAKQRLDAEAHLRELLKNFGLELILEQAKEMGRLNDVINAISGEVRTHKKDKKQKDEIISILAVERTNLENDKLDLATKKMILETEKLNLKEENERLKNGKSN